MTKLDRMNNEWKACMENARHFNDLLIRFRMLGLPMVITLAVAGIAAGAFAQDIMLFKWALPSFTGILAIGSIVAVVWHTVKKCKNKTDTENRERDKCQEPPLSFEWLELIMWLILIAILVAFTVINLKGFTETGKNAVSVTSLALLASVILLLSLYFMDRFYYYKLLIGAVSRLTTLEDKLRYSVTARTTEFMPRQYATNMVSSFYCIPAIVLLAFSCLSV